MTFVNTRCSRRSLVAAIAIAPTLASAKAALPDPVIAALGDAQIARQRLLAAALRSDAAEEAWFAGGRAPGEAHSRALQALREAQQDALVALEAAEAAVLQSIPTSVHGALALIRFARRRLATGEPAAPELAMALAGLEAYLSGGPHPIATAI